MKGRNDSQYTSYVPSTPGPRRAQTNPVVWRLLLQRNVYLWNVRVLSRYQWGHQPGGINPVSLRTFQRGDRASTPAPKSTNPVVLPLCTVGVLKRQPRALLPVGFSNIFPLRTPTTIYSAWLYWGCSLMNAETKNKERWRRSFSVPTTCAEY